MRTKPKTILVLAVLISAFVQAVGGEFGTDPKERKFMADIQKPADTTFIADLANLRMIFTNPAPLPDRTGDNALAYYGARSKVVNYVKANTNDPSARYQASLLAVQWLQERDHAMAASNSAQTFNRYSERTLAAWQILLATTVLHAEMSFSNAVKFIGPPSDESGPFAIWRYQMPKGSNDYAPHGGTFRLRAAKTGDGTIREWYLERN